MKYGRKITKSILAIYVGDICQESRLERVYQKRDSFGLDLTDEFSLPREVRDTLILEAFFDDYGFSDP